MSDVKREVLDSLIDAHLQELEYVLRGAWRMGYKYVHVYDPEPQPFTNETTFTIKSYYYESNTPAPARPRDKVYRFTYDLTAVSDEQMREAITQGATDA